MAEAPPPLPPRLIVVEPYNGGSHGQMTTWLSALTLEAAAAPCGAPIVVALPAKKWHWRLRASALWAAQTIPALPQGTTRETCTLYASSMLNLAELLALRPDIQRCARKVLYFHENQLEFPLRTDVRDATGHADGSAATDQLGRQGDFQYGWAQIMSALSADVCAFNSIWNRDSFLAAIDRHLRTIPDKAQRVPGLAGAIRGKSVVAYFPVDVPRVLAPASPRSGPLVVCWNHRHEFDKRPDVFFQTLRWMEDKRLPYRVVVLGETFAEEPPEFAAARAWLEPAGRVLHWGYAPSKEAYFAVLRQCDVVVSTAAHEFFGVSVVEATLCGAYPLCPDRLSYPELLAPSHEQVEQTASLAVVGQVQSILASASGRQSVFPIGSHSEALAAALPSTSHPAAAGSPHLYKTERDLRQRLYSLAKNPEPVRAWRSRFFGVPGTHEATTAGSCGSLNKTGGAVSGQPLLPSCETTAVSQHEESLHKKAKLEVGPLGMQGGSMSETGCSSVASSGDCGEQRRSGSASVTTGAHATELVPGALQRFSTRALTSVYQALIGDCGANTGDARAPSRYALAGPLIDPYVYSSSHNYNPDASTLTDPPP